MTCQLEEHGIFNPLTEMLAGQMKCIQSFIKLMYWTILTKELPTNSFIKLQKWFVRPVKGALSE
jgi:hypothetical protein